MTPNFSVPACMHPSAVAALALGPPGACQTNQSPPQPRHGGCRLCQPSLFQQGVVGAFAEGFGVLTSDFGVGKSQDLGLQPIMPLDLPVKVRSWELTVYPRSHIRRWFGVTRPAQARM